MGDLYRDWGRLGETCRDCGTLIETGGGGGGGGGGGEDLQRLGVCDSHT